MADEKKRGGGTGEHKATSPNPSSAANSDTQRLFTKLDCDHNGVITYA
jgi:hypothetical protein